MLKGRFLNPGEAKKQYDAFWDAGGGNLPQAVCYKLKDLAEFYMKANEVMAADGVPEDQRGVALMIGIHLDQGSSHAKNKPTIMMVATQWVDNSDPNAGKTDSINNPIIKDGWPVAFAPPPNITDTSYDAGSLWP